MRIPVILTKFLFNAFFIIFSIFYNRNSFLSPQYFNQKPSPVHFQPSPTEDFYLKAKDLLQATDKPLFPNVSYESPSLELNGKPLNYLYLPLCSYSIAQSLCSFYGISSTSTSTAAITPLQWLSKQ